MRGCLVASALLVSAGPALADAPAGGGTSDFSHKGQVGASARFALGLRALATYDSRDYCGDTDPQGAFGFAPVCTGRAPFSIDFELGYGVARRVDLLLELRVGLEADIGAMPGGDGPRMLHLS